jgi:hypothetical protein
MRLEINWQSLYKNLSAPICSVNCGVLCAPNNNGIPHCCTHTNQEPLLFTNELAWLATKTDLWQAKPLRTKADRRAAAAIDDYIKYAHCKGIYHCKRGYRSLSCRFFPLEPYFETANKFAGLTYIYRAQNECPLINHPTIKINPHYVDQAIDVWTEIFIAFPQEIDLYVNVSRGLRRSMNRSGKKIAVFRGTMQ